MTLIRPRWAALLVLIMLASGSFHGSPAAQETAEPSPPYAETIAREGVIQDRYGNDLKAYYRFPAVDGERAPGQFPAILVFSYLGPTLGGGEGGEQTAFLEPNDPDPSEGRFWAENGYAYVVVDMPGRGSSSGWHTLDGIGLGRSGYDVVEWLAGLRPDGSPSPDAEWTTGMVGMTGRSGNGLVQLLVAQQHPPHLKALAPEVAPWDLYRDLFYPGGMRTVTQWASVAAAYNGTAVPCQDVPTTEDQLRYSASCLERRADSLTFVPLDMADVLQHPNYDRFWETKSADLSRIDIPIWSMGTWDDFFTDGSTKLFTESASRNSLLTMGVGGHTIRNSLDHLPELLAWFDRWLKQDRNDIDAQLREASFRYYLQRGDMWRYAKTYPIPGTEYTELYLGSSTADIPQPASGTLSSEPPAGSGSVSYEYAPIQGLTTGQYGSLRGTHPNAAGETAPRPVTLLDPTSPGDQRLEALTSPHFLSEPLSTNTEVTGPVEVTFYAESTSSDTDWVAHLVDVYPEEGPANPDDPTPGGYRYKVTSGWLSGIHRTSLAQPEPIPPGEVIKYTIDLYPTSYLFRKGHRIGLVIASADAAHTQPNRNPATNTIHFGLSTPSYVTVPIVPEGRSFPDPRSRIP